MVDRTVTLERLRNTLFRYIEFGWLIALSAILTAAALVLIRRRAA